MQDVPSTVAREVHWFARGGVARLPDGRSFAIDVDPIVVGRAAEAHIALDDREVSAMHCELRAGQDGILVKDLGSTNGTFLGAFRIREGTVTTASEVVVGKTVIRIEPISAAQKVNVGYNDRFGPLVGCSPRMRRVFSVLARVAPTPLSILVLGETGTGKELVARAIHDASPRKGKPFVVVDCGSIPATLAEGLLFGHEKGSFTGATERKKGALAEAHEGTLFLDELGELPADIQPKLLRALSERQVKRVGGSAYEPIDVRILAATRRDLAVEMNANRFRSDLFFRIAQVRVELPSLRDRRADIPMLVDDVCARQGVPHHATAVNDWIAARMESHDWPGNVRELVNVASVAATLADTPGAIDDVLTLTRGDIEPSAAPPRAAVAAFVDAKRAAVLAFEKDYFAGLLESTSANVSEMSRQSGMERHHVRAFLRKHGLEKGPA